MNKIAETILNYLSQSSTYKGLFTLLAALGISFSGDLSNSIAGVCLAIVGLINVILNEHKSEKTNV